MRPSRPAHPQVVDLCAKLLSQAQSAPSTYSRFHTIGTSCSLCQSRNNPRLHSYRSSAHYCSYHNASSLRHYLRRLAASALPSICQRLRLSSRQSSQHIQWPYRQHRLDLPFPSVSDIGSNTQRRLTTGFLTDAYHERASYTSYDTRDATTEAPPSFSPYPRSIKSPHWPSQEDHQARSCPRPQ